MKSSYERKKYVYSCALAGLVFLCVLAVWFYIAFGGNVKNIVVSVVLAAAGIAALMISTS